jgi:CheY-like chemotaxis protein
LAATGRQVLELLERESFDVILMDVQMPEIDGYEAAKAIRAREAETGSHTPIIAMTAHAMKGDRERCLAMGMDDYVSKPIDWRELNAAMRRVLPFGPELPPATRAAPADGVPAVTRDLGANLDWAKLWSQVGGDKELLEHLARGFLREYPQLLAAVREHVLQADCRALGESSHRLKGLIGWFPVTSTLNAASRLETMAKNGDLMQPERELTELELGLERLAHELRTWLGERS